MRHIVRLAATELKGEMPLRIALTKIKGIGFSFSNAILKVTGMDGKKPVGLLSDEEIEKLEDCIYNPQKYGIPSWLYNRRKDLESGKDLHLTGADLEIRIKQDIEFMKKIKCYKGIRHALGLKVRGQRTRSTGRKGRTVGVVKKKKR